LNHRNFPVANSPVPGLTVMYASRLGLGDQFPNARLWTAGIKPTERVGKTTYLWYIEPAAGQIREGSMVR